MIKKTCCCICLSTNKRTVNIYRTYLLYFYEQLANYKVRDSDCWMCYICQMRLQQCHRLQQLAVQTRGLVDGLCRNKTDIDIGAIGSLLELSIYKKKNISTTHHTADNIKEEPDIKTEQYNEDEIIEEQTVENTNTYGEDYAPVLEFEDDDVSDGDAVCKQESLSVDRIDARQGSRVLELKLVKLSQSVIDKYVRQSPTRQHTATEEHVGDKGKCADEQSVEDEDKRAQYKSHKEQLICDVCFKMFPTKSRLIRHIRTHTGIKHEDERPNTDDCEGRGHASAAQSSKTPHTCDVCLKTYSTRRQLLRNMKTHTRLVSCDTCTKNFSNKQVLIAHMSVHTGEKPFSCDIICSKKFSRKSTLTIHKRFHTGEKLFSCDICSKNFCTKSYLTIHIARIHKDEKPFSCNFCPRKLFTQKQLTVHTRAHTGEKPYSCDVCSKKFSSKTYLTQHKIFHTGVKPYSCDICPSKFTTQKDLTVHTRVHTGEKPFSCDICSKKFSRQGNLTAHTRIHTGEKPFSCDICSKKFSQQSSLTLHTRLHTNEKPFSCDICSKKFSRKGDLTVHTRVHTGEKPFSCDICSKIFTLKKKLVQHLEIHLS